MIRQNTVAVGQPVLNIHGRSPATLASASTSAAATWLRLTVPGTDLVALDEFYVRYAMDESKPFSLIDAPNGVASVTDPTAVIQLYRGVVSLDFPTLVTLDIDVGSTASKVALYVDGVLDRSRTAQLTTSRLLDAGDHMLEIMVVGTQATLTTDLALPIDGLKDIVLPPIWAAASSGYLDTASSSTVVTLTWFADNRSGGWKLYRRQLLALGTISSVGSVERSGQFSLIIAGDASSSLAVGADLLAGTNLIGTVIQTNYSSISGTTSVRVKLADRVTQTSQGWINRMAYSGQNVEVTKVKRTQSGGTVSFADTSVAFNVPYAYTLQAFGLFDDSQLSPVSETRYINAGDVTPPGSITIQNKGVPTIGYPQIRDKVARVRYRTPLDTDYAGVRVTYRTSATGTVSSISGATIGVTVAPGLTANSAVNWTLRLTSGAANFLERTVQSNTTTAVTLSAGFDTVNTPAIGDTVLLYNDTTLVIDYGAPNTDDELQFTTVGYGTYLFRAFDLVGNTQTDTACESWTYDSSMDVATVINLPPTITLTQLSDTTQSTFFTAGDVRNDPTQYAIVLLAAADPLQVSPTAGVTIFYQVTGGTQQSFAATTAATAGAVDVPGGTRNRYILLQRGSTASLNYWATDAQGLQSDVGSFTADLNSTPELVNVESRDVGGGNFQLTVNVDDDTRGIQYYMTPAGAGEPSQGSPTHLDCTTVKTQIFSTLVTDGTTKTVTIVPYTQFSGGVATGTVGDSWVKELTRSPRTTATFESRDTSGNISGTTVRVNLITQPIRNAIATRTAAGSGNTTTSLTDAGTPGWTALQYQYSDLSKRYYFVEFTSGALAGQVRKIVGNGTNTLSFSPAVASAPDGLTYRIWNAATIVNTDGFAVGTQVPIGTAYVVGTTIFLDRKGDSALNFDYNSVLTGSIAETLKTISVDKDSAASLGGLTVTESPAGTVSLSVGTFDDDTKFWRIYARKGALPTISSAALTRSTATGRLNLDDAFLRWEDTPARTNFSFTVGAGTWYFIVVPYNSYNEDGDPASATLAISGSGPSPSPALTGLAVAPNGTSENDLSWSLVNLSNPTGYTVTITAQLDNLIPSTLTTTTAASALAYAHTGIGTRATNNSGGTWKTYLYTVQLKNGSGVAVGAPVTVQRQDYFAGAVPTLNSASALVYNPGDAVPAGGGGLYACDGSHNNLVSWSITGVNDTDFIMNVSKAVNGASYGLISQVNPSVGSYNDIEDLIYEAAGGTSRTWSYKVDLVRRSDSGIQATATAPLLTATVKRCVSM